MMDGPLCPVDPEGCAPSFGASTTKPHVVGEGTDFTGGRETPKAKVRGGVAFSESYAEPGSFAGHPDSVHLSAEGP